MVSEYGKATIKLNQNGTGILCDKHLGELKLIPLRYSKGSLYI